MHPRWEIPGFDFRPDGGWRVKARRVAAVRKQLLASGSFSALNGPTAMARGRVQAQGGVSGPSLTTAVSGTQNVPALIFGYKNTPASLYTQHTPANYSQLLFGSTPLAGTPYSVRTFYEQMSNSLLSMQGQVLGWVTLDSNETFYTGTAGTCNQNPFGTTNCNGIFSVAATNAMQNGMRSALTRLDTGAAGINWGQFDNDGPDGTPNSGDDDGYVDMLMFAHATRDGACGGSTNNHIWSHRFFFVNASQTNFQDFVTNDASAEGGTIRISDYFVASALGGVTSCDSTQIMPIGTAAHEFGHALGLPDLYDTGQLTEGIGQWGLMGSGNFASPLSPARFEAWSLSEMGWVTLVPLTTTNTYHFGAIPTSDTAFIVNVQGPNPRGEYFLLENRQASLADTALIRIHCLRSGNPPGCGGGMLVWHVDQTQIDAHGFRAGNEVNTGSIHGLHLEQADGLNQLDDPNATFPRRRGDAGDPYPGVAANPAFAVRTTPAAVKNVDRTAFTGFTIDSIRQVVPGGEMAFRLRFGGISLARANDSAAVVQVDGSPFNVFRDLLDDGSSHTVSVADTQLSGNQRTRYRFASWSDGGARTHTISGVLSGDTTIATLTRDFKLIATATAGGTITPDTAINLAGEFIQQGRAVQLTATPDVGVSFFGWTGDTATANATIVLPMGRPYSVTANFGTTLAISTAAARPNGVMGATYADTLRATGGTGTFSWSVTGGALPQGVTLAASTGVVSGFPRSTGNFTYTATVTSASQTQSRAFTFSVTAPTLATANVVAQLLGPSAPLNADEVRYLDYLGNVNGGFDIGDFLAWVKTTGAPLSAALMEAIQRKGGRQ